MNLYLKRYASAKQLISEEPSPELGMVVVIPCYNEPALAGTLNSLANCMLPGCSVEVIVIINEPAHCEEKVRAQNRQSWKEAIDWRKKASTDKLRYHIHYIALPDKHAGVGMARQIGMDEAVRRFEFIGNHQEGIIVCFDADSLCDKNYLAAIEDHFRENPTTPGCTIYYEHPLEGNLGGRIYSGIIKYELFLRYYVDALRFAGFPYAFQTIGSSMAVRSSAYQKQGGMNRKKAGEDFYFLHKIIPLGRFTELNTTRVIPSPRASDRVPFGTGKAIQNWLDSGEDYYPAYHPQSFIDLKAFLRGVDGLYKAPAAKVLNFMAELPASVQTFLEKQQFPEKAGEINRNSGNIASFRKRFYHWMNGFRVLKYIHYAQETYYPPVEITEAARWLWKEYHTTEELPKNAKELLYGFRKTDRSYLNAGLTSSKAGRTGL